MCYVACSSSYNHDSRTGVSSVFQDFVFVSQNDCLVIVQANIDSLGWQSSKCFSAGNVYVFQHLVFTGCNAELGAFIFSADDFTELLPGTKAQMLHKKVISNVKQDMDRRPWILDNARVFADAVILSGKQYIPYSEWTNSSSAPCPSVRFRTQMGNCLWIGEALNLSDDSSLNEDVSLPAGACVVCACCIGDIRCFISLSISSWTSVLEMFEAHCCMADSQFFAVEPLSVLRLLDTSNARQKVSDLATWLDGTVWRVSLVARILLLLFGADSIQVKIQPSASSDSSLVSFHAQELFPV
jgi:hypothetical protein